MLLKPLSTSFFKTGSLEFVIHEISIPVLHLLYAMPYLVTRRIEFYLLISTLNPVKILLTLKGKSEQGHKLNTHTHRRSFVELGTRNVHTIGVCSFEISTGHVQ